jgi:hypothetical protein
MVVFNIVPLSVWFGQTASPEYVAASRGGALRLHRDELPDKPSFPKNQPSPLPRVTPRRAVAWNTLDERIQEPVTSAFAFGAMALSEIFRAEPRTTRLYDRRQTKITRNIAERISV